MRAALQFGGNLAELCCKFEQCQPRVDLRGLARELQAFFCVLSAFFWRRHDSDPSCETPIPALSFRSATYNSRAPTVPDSILDNPSTGRNAPRRRAASPTSSKIRNRDG